MAGNDPNLILTLKAGNEQTAAALSYNTDLYLAPIDNGSWEFDSREPTPSVNPDDKERIDFQSQIRLRFDRKPKHLPDGFVFGSNPKVCDVLIGRKKDTISGRHFNITFDDQRRVIVRDTSTEAGTSVSYDGECGTQKRKHFPWILFKGVRKKKILVANRFELIVELANHEGCEAEFNALVDRYLEDSREAMPAINNLGVESQQTTAPPTLPQTPTEARSLESTLKTQPPIYYCDKLLGSGEFGTVHRAFNVSTGCQYAAKFFFRGNFKKEVEILKGSLHQHIVHFVDYTEEIKPCLIMQYLCMGNLAQQHKNSAISVREVMILLDQSLQALTYMHPRGITHRDIKPENILFQTRYPIYIKLADFGLASNSSTLNTICGTQLYSAPEIWKGTSYTKAVDIWSLGLIAFEYAYSLPTHENTDFDSEWWYRKLLRAVNDWDTDGLINFLSSSMLVKDPEGRKNAHECLAELKSLPLPLAQVWEETPNEIMSCSSMITASITERVEDSPRASQVVSGFRSDLRRRSSSKIGDNTDCTEERTVILPQKCGEPRRSLKRLSCNIQESRRNLRSKTTPAFQKGIESEYVTMHFREMVVSLRKHDLWLNATQILILAGQDVNRRTQTLEVIERHTVVEKQNKTSWICFEHGQFLAQALGLQNTLKPLLLHHHQDLSFDEGRIPYENYLLDYIRVSVLKSCVMIRKLDFRVNGTQILRLAGKSRGVMTTIRRKGIPHDIVSGKATKAGTYVDFQYGLRLCEQYSLAELKSRLLSARESNHAILDHMVGSNPTGIYESRKTTSDSNLADAMVQRKRIASQQQPNHTPNFGHPQIAPTIEQTLKGLPCPPNVGICTPGGPADDDMKQTPPSFFTEPSYSKGSFLPVLNPSHLEQVYPNFDNHENSDQTVGFPSSPTNLASMQVHPP